VSAIHHSLTLAWLALAVALALVQPQGVLHLCACKSRDGWHQWLWLCCMHNHGSKVLPQGLVSWIMPSMNTALEYSNMCSVSASLTRAQALLLVGAVSGVTASGACKTHTGRTHTWSTYLKRAVTSYPCQGASVFHHGIQKTSAKISLGTIMAPPDADVWQYHIITHWQCHSRGVHGRCQYQWRWC
jgi:hypothetical protein